MKKKNRTVAFLAMCTSLAMILAYAEMLLTPLFPALPGIKMGLPNVVIVFLLYKKGALEAISVSLLRVVLVGMLFGNTMSFVFSFAGAIVSFLVMLLLRKMNVMSCVGVSVSGAIMHNLGQILMAMLLLNTAELGYYMAVLVFTAVISGTFVGLCGSLLVKKIPDKLIG